MVHNSNASLLSKMPKWKRTKRDALWGSSTSTVHPTPSTVAVENLATSTSTAPATCIVVGKYHTPSPYHRDASLRGKGDREAGAMEERDIEAQNQADIASARFLANYHRQNDRPHNTKVNYYSKQRAWKEWCSDRRFKDLDTVTDGKLLLWLQDAIIPQGNRSSGEKKGSMLSKSGLEGYVKSIVDLYEVRCIPFIFFFLSSVDLSRISSRWPSEEM